MLAEQENHYYNELIDKVSILSYCLASISIDPLYQLWIYLLTK